MSKKCLECGEELTSSEAIIFHSCEAYPKREDEGSWVEILLKNRKGEVNGN
jgi:hypothetical protein